MVQRVHYPADRSDTTKPGETEPEGSQKTFIAGSPDRGHSSVYYSPCCHRVRPKRDRNAVPISSRDRPGIARSGHVDRVYRERQVAADYHDRKGTGIESYRGQSAYV